jgi:Arc/MetJ family transcription regulator
MRTNIVLDDELVAEAFSVCEAKTKKELIHLALKELVRIKKKKNLLDLAGRIQLDENYDHKATRETRNVGD